MNSSFLNRTRLPEWWANRARVRFLWMILCVSWRMRTRSMTLTWGWMEYFFSAMFAPSSLLGATTIGLHSGNLARSLSDSCNLSLRGRSMKRSEFICVLQRLAKFILYGRIYPHLQTQCFKNPDEDHIELSLQQKMESSLKVIPTEFSEELLSDFVLTKTKIGSDQKIIPSLLNCSLSYTDNSLPSNNVIQPQPQTAAQPAPAQAFVPIDMNLAVTKKKIPARGSPKKEPEHQCSRSPVKSLIRQRPKHQQLGTVTPTNQSPYATAENPCFKRSRANTIEKNLSKENMEIRQSSMDKTMKYFNRVYNLGNTLSVRKQKTVGKQSVSKPNFKGKLNIKNITTTNKKTIKVQPLDFSQVHSDIYKQLQNSWRNTNRRFGAQTDKYYKKQTVAGAASRLAF